jgi:acyl carrier protein
MNDSDPAILAKICELLQAFNKKGVALEPDLEIMTGLEIDSVAVMDFVMEVEDHFDIDIPLNVLSETRSIQDLVKVVAERTMRAA